MKCVIRRGVCHAGKTVGSHSEIAIQIGKETNLLRRCCKMEENPVKPEETVEEKQEETKEEVYGKWCGMRV